MRYLKIFTILVAFILHANLSTATNYIFNPPIKINDNIDTSEQFTQSQRSIAAKGNSVYMVWVDYRSGNDIYFAKSDDQLEVALVSLKEAIKSETVEII